MRRGVTIFLLLSAVQSVCLSQQVDYVFKHFTRDDQLASNQVNAILKDHNGYMWFATGNGVQKFDGKRFVTYQHIPNDSNSEFCTRSSCVVADIFLRSSINAIRQNPRCILPGHHHLTPLRSSSMYQTSF